MLNEYFSYQKDGEVDEAKGESFVYDTGDVADLECPISVEDG